MISQTKSPRTAAAIGAAMESACACGDVKVVERRFESYRQLFEDHQAQKPLSCSNRAATDISPNANLNILDHENLPNDRHWLPPSPRRS